MAEETTNRHGFFHYLYGYAKPLVMVPFAIDSGVREYWKIDLDFHQNQENVFRRVAGGGLGMLIGGGIGLAEIMSAICLSEKITGSMLAGIGLLAFTNYLDGRRTEKRKRSLESKSQSDNPSQ